MQNRDQSMIRDFRFFVLGKVDWRAPLLLSALLVYLSFNYFLLFHTLAEFFAIMIAIIMFVVAWEMRQFSRNNFLVFLGIGYFWIAGLDLLHALAYSGMNILPVIGGNPSIQLWISTRYIEALLLLFAPLFLTRHLYTKLSFIFFGLVAAFIAAFVLSGNFPDCFIEGKGLTKFKVYSEYLVIGILALAVYHLLRRRVYIEKRIMYLMVASIMLTMGAELAFTFYVSVYGLSNMVGHIFKLFSFWLIFTAVIRTTLQEPFVAMARSSSSYDAIPDITIIVDANHIIRSVNKPASQFASIAKVDLVGKHCHDVFHPTHLTVGQCQICHNIKNNISLLAVDIEYPAIQKWFEFSLSPIITPGTTKGMVQVMRDVSERRKSEEQVRKLSHAVKYSPATVVITNTEGNIEYANPKFTQLTGYTNEEAIGKNPRILKSGETPPEIYKELWETITSGNEWKGEFCNKKKNGKLYWESASISPVKNAEGVITNFIAVKDDITERKYSERRLSAQHAVTQVLVESTTIKEASPKIIQAICTALGWDLGEIWIFDQQAGVLCNTDIWHKPSLQVSEFKAVTKNTTFPAKIGLPGSVWESAKPLWIEDVVQDANFPRASIAEKEGLHGAFGFPIIIGSEVCGTLCFYSREIKKPDNYLLDMMTSIGRQIGLFIKHKQAEETLLQSEKLRAMGMITAGIAHDFNNILAIISGSTQILEMGNEDNKKLVDGLRTILKASNDGAEIVRRMRIFTKQEKDTSMLQPVDIKGVLTQAIDFVKPRWMNIAKAGGINYEIDKDGIVEVPTIMGIESELREVFINMMNNAMDAMPEGGFLSFCTWQSEENVFISISDTGEGMSVDVKNRVFEPFYTTKREKGSGLGMSMSYGIIERHDGGIEVESEEGKGTTFTIRLPITESPTQKTGLSVEDQKIKVKGLSILVVDDKKDMCSLLEKFFAKNSHIVKTAESGNRAIEVLKAETFDLVLCDLVMPDVSGHKVVDVLNSLDKRPKIGVMTGWSEKVETKDENELNVDFIIKKPFNFSVLAGHINDIFGTD